MATNITFQYKDKDYTLEYNRKAVQAMERQGFVLSEIGDKPATLIPLLFKGAFMFHHSSVKHEVIDDIYEKITDKDGLLAKLMEMYSETVSVLMGEPEEAEGNIQWGANSF